MYKKNLVSIITPNYNCARFIAQTIESVQLQTYPDWELIIIDDCSTDNSFQIAQSYAEMDRRIKLLKNEKNSGAALSRNRGLDIAQGEFIAFLDSDDLWTKDKLEKQLLFMRENACDFCYAGCDIIDEENKSLGKRLRVTKNLSYWKLLHFDFVGCLTAVYRADIAKDIRSFNVKNNNDYGLFLQVIKNARNAKGLNEIVGYYRIRKTSLSRKKTKKVKPYFTLMVKFIHIPFVLACWFLLTNIVIGKVYKFKSINK